MSSGARSETVVFLHIPKTAGSSARVLLSRQFEPDEVAEPRPPEAWGREQVRYLSGQASAPPAWSQINPNAHLEAYLRRLPPGRLDRLGLVQGHYWYGVHRALPRPAAYVTILRDPVERVLSLHAHRVRVQGLSLSLEEYIREGRDFNLDNGQVRRLAGVTEKDPRFVPVTEEILQLAKRHLREVRVVGVTESFDLFLVLLGREFGWRGLTDLSLNRDQDRPRAPDVDPHIVEQIRAINRADQALYDHALELIAERTEPDRVRIDREVRRLRSRTVRREMGARVTKKLRGAFVKLNRALRERGSAGAR